jgi:hypothetical protein
MRAACSTAELFIAIGATSAGVPIGCTPLSYARVVSSPSASLSCFPRVALPRLDLKEMIWQLAPTR